MRAAAAVLAASLIAGTLAHFQLQYPAPRGDFVEDSARAFVHVHQCTDSCSGAQRNLPFVTATRMPSATAPSSPLRVA
jgi:hypothetical protein